MCSMEKLHSLYPQEDEKSGIHRIEFALHVSSDLQHFQTAWFENVATSDEFFKNALLYGSIKSYKIK